MALPLIGKSRYEEDSESGNQWRKWGLEQQLSIGTHVSSLFTADRRNTQEVAVVEGLGGPSKQVGGLALL